MSRNCCYCMPRREGRSRRPTLTCLYSSFLHPQWLRKTRRNCARTLRSEKPRVKCRFSSSRKYDLESSAARELFQIERLDRVFLHAGHEKATALRVVADVGRRLLVGEKDLERDPERALVNRRGLPARDDQRIAERDDAVERSPRGLAHVLLLALLVEPVDFARAERDDDEALVGHDETVGSAEIGALRERLHFALFDRVDRVGLRRL